MADHGMATPVAESCDPKGSLHTPYSNHRKSPSHLRRDLQRSHYYRQSLKFSPIISPLPTGSSIPLREAREYPQGDSNVGDPDTSNVMSCLSDTVKTSPTHSCSQPGVTNDPFNAVDGEENNNNNNTQSADSLNTVSRKAKTISISNNSLQPDVIASSHDTSSSEATNTELPCSCKPDNGMEFQDQPNQKQQRPPPSPQQQVQQEEKQQQINTDSHFIEINPCKRENATHLPQKIFCNDSYQNFEKFLEFHDSDKLRKYVYDLDPMIKEKLMDWNRNTNFTKVVIDKFKEKTSLIAQTDDLVIECDLENFKLHHWFAVKAASDSYETMRIRLRHLILFEAFDIDHHPKEASLVAR